MVELYLGLKNLEVDIPLFMFFFCPRQTGSEMGLWNGYRLYVCMFGCLDVWMDVCEENVNLFWLTVTWEWFE